MELQSLFSIFIFILFPELVYFLNEFLKLWFLILLIFKIILCILFRVSRNNSEKNVFIMFFSFPLFNQGGVFEGD